MKDLWHSLLFSFIKLKQANFQGHISMVICFTAPKQENKDKLEENNINAKGSCDFSSVLAILYVTYQNIILSAEKYTH